MPESTPPHTTSCTAFNYANLIASGDFNDVAQKCREVFRADPNARLLIFDDSTGEVIDVDLRRTPVRPVADSQTKGTGRPKLGVVAREITLLPRHWEWLATQPGGASVALRKLVEHAMKANRDQDSLRRGQEATYRFVSAMAGDEPGFEEAIRALFAGREQKFNKRIRHWPADVREYARKLAASAFTGGQ